MRYKHLYSPAPTPGSWLVRPLDNPMGCCWEINIDWLIGRCQLQIFTLLASLDRHRATCDLSDIWYSFKMYFSKLYNSELYFLQSVPGFTHLLSVYWSPYQNNCREILKTKTKKNNNKTFHDWFHCYFNQLYNCDSCKLLCQSRRENHDQCNNNEWHCSTGEHWWFFQCSFYHMCLVTLYSTRINHVIYMIFGVCIILRAREMFYKNKCEPEMWYIESTKYVLKNFLQR